MQAIFERIVWRSHFTSQAEPLWLDSRGISYLIPFLEYEAAILVHFSRLFGSVP